MQQQQQVGLIEREREKLVSVAMRHITRKLCEHYGQLATLPLTQGIPRFIRTNPHSCCAGASVCIYMLRYHHYHYHNDQLLFAQASLLQVGHYELASPSCGLQPTSTSLVVAADAC